MRTPLRIRFTRFLSGRNGPDCIYWTILFLSVGLMVISFFVFSVWLYVAEAILLLYAFWRVFSRNVAKRRREAAAFSRFWMAGPRFMAFRVRRFRERKTHIYHRCPHCRRMLRLKRIKGEHDVRCPRCRALFPITIKR